MQFKIVIVGEIGSGKTSLIKRQTNNFYSENPKVTFGVNFAKLSDKEVDVHLWDIAGQEINGNMLKLFSQQAHMFIVVADLTKSTALESIKKWLTALEELKVLPEDNAPILVATKSDAAARVIQIDTLVEFAKKHQLIFDAITHVTSAKTGDKVTEFFECVLEEVKKMQPKPVVTAQAAFFKPIPLEAEDDQSEYLPIFGSGGTFGCCNFI